MQLLETKFTKHLTAKMKRHHCEEEEDKALEMEREVLFGAVKEVCRVVVHDTRLFKVEDEIKRLLSRKLV